MITLLPWALGPFELILHAEMHYRNGEDFDRRIALVGYDNAIEVAVHTYLSLHPLQRQNREYPRADVEKWLYNFHSKIDFFAQEVHVRQLAMVCDKAEFFWYHDVRNTQYHVGGAAIPQGRELDGIRRAAMWVFGVLFEVSDVEAMLEQYLEGRSGDDLPSRTDDDDRRIDREFGTIELAGRVFYTSEVLHAVDPVLYSELANEVLRLEEANVEMDQGAQP